MKSLKEIFTHNPSRAGKSQGGLHLGRLADLGRLQRHWAELVGPAIAEAAMPMTIRRDAVVIRVTDQVWCAELRMMAHQLRDRLHQLGLPKDMKFQFEVGDLPQPVVAVGKSSRVSVPPTIPWQQMRAAGVVPPTWLNELLLRVERRKSNNQTE